VVLGWGLESAERRISEMRMTVTAVFFSIPGELGTGLDQIKIFSVI